MPEQGSNENVQSDAGDRNREVHRALKVMTPMMTGPDVERLQKGINGWSREQGLELHVKVDAEFGPKTLGKSNRCAFLQGHESKDPDRVDANLLSESEQDLIRHPEKRTEQMRDLSKDRVAAALKALAAADRGADAAIKYAMSKVGVTEHPLGSNRGPEVDMWTRFCRLNPPVFWCGCFAAYCVVHEGGAHIDPFHLIHHQTITNYARAGVNGLEAVPLSGARKGDIVTFTFQHIALVREDYDGGALKTVEGNTSGTSAGSQNNGGGVYAKERSSGILQVCRPAYPRS